MIPTRTAAVACIAVLALSAAGCGDQGHQPMTPEQRQLIVDLEQLRGDDGLFLPAADRGEPGLYTSAFGLTALAGAGKSTALTIDGPAVRKTLGPQLAADPLWGRLYLTRIDQQASTRAADATDASTLASMQSPDGFYADPVAPPATARDNTYRIATTAAALEALSRLGTLPQGTNRTAVTDWLAAIRQGEIRSLSSRLQWTQARLILGMPAPPDNEAALDGWWRANANAAAPASGDLLAEACSYVVLASIAHRSLIAQRARLEKMLDPAATRPGDPQIAAAVVLAWTELGAPRSRLAPILQIISRHRLPTGLMSAIQELHGDLLATDAVVSLRAAASVPTDDAALTRSLISEQRSALAGSDPTAPSLWLAALERAGGHASDDLARRIRADLPGVLSQPLAQDNAEQWAALVRNMRTLGIPVPSIQVTPWRADTPSQRYARSVAIATLSDAGQLDHWRNLPAANDLAANGLELLAQDSLRQAAAALRAAYALGWRPSTSERTRIAAELAPLKGCPGTPALYREASVSTCNVYSTLAAWQIRLIADT